MCMQYHMHFCSLILRKAHFATYPQIPMYSKFEIIPNAKLKVRRSIDHLKDQAKICKYLTNDLIKIQTTVIRNAKSTEENCP